MFRRIVFLILGVLECLAAIVLSVFAWGMPGAAEVHDGVSRVNRVAEQTSGQVLRLREELHTLREQRPKLRAMADNLRRQMDLATANLKDQSVDGGAANAVEQSLGDMAGGLDGLSDAFNPDGVERMAAGFKTTADKLDASGPLLGADARKLARQLRQAQKGVEDSAAQWPELRRTLAEAAKLLRATQAQMQSALVHRDEYEKALHQVIVFARAYAAALPLMTELVDEKLRDQEDSLQNLCDSIDRTTAVLPEWDRTASRVLETARLLLVLMAAIFGLHGTYLVVEAWGRRRGSGAGGRRAAAQSGAGVENSCTANDASQCSPA